MGDGRQCFKARVGFAAWEIPIEQSICVHALASGVLLVIPDLTKDARTRQNPLVSSKAGLRFYAGAPLILSGGVVIGVLCVIDRVAQPRGLGRGNELFRR